MSDNAKPASGCAVEGLVGAPKRPARAGDCREIYALRPVGRENTPSARVTWCCRRRHGFMLTHWKCLGLDHPDCPNAELTGKQKPQEGTPA